MKGRKGAKRIPWTGCSTVRTRDISVLNPEEVGVSGVPVVGRCHARSVRDGADLHRHRYLEITVCEPLSDDEYAAYARRIEELGILERVKVRVG